MSFEIKSRSDQPEKSRRFEQYNDVFGKIKRKTEQIKQKYDAENTEMDSFSPDLLPTNERPMMLSNDVYADYQRILRLTNENNAEYNFLWLGNRRTLDSQEYYSIEKVITLPQPSILERSSANPLEKIEFYNSTNEHDDYDVIIDGHSHPAQEPSYNGFDQLPQPLIDELSLRKPGENYSINDLGTYRLLLESKIKDKTIIGSVITYTGELLTAVSDPNDNAPIPTTIRQIGAEATDDTIILPTSKFDEEKSRRFFEE